MTSEDKVRRVYPDAYYESLFGGIKDRGNDDEWLSTRSLPPKSAWADAWRRIQAARKDGGK